MSAHHTTQKLNTLESFKLMSWAQQSEVLPRLALDRDEDLAAEASKFLGFLITRSNIKGVRDALDISKRPARGAPTQAQLAADISELAAFVVGMANQLGMQVPARVATILER